MKAFAFLNGSKKSQQNRQRGEQGRQLSIMVKNTRTSSEYDQNEQQSSTRPSPSPAPSTRSFFSSRSSSGRTGTSGYESVPLTPNQSSSSKSRPSLSLAFGRPSPAPPSPHEDALPEQKPRSPVYTRFIFSKSSPQLPQDPIGPLSTSNPPEPPFSAPPVPLLPARFATPEPVVPLWALPSSPAQDSFATQRATLKPPKASSSVEAFKGPLSENSVSESVLLQRRRAKTPLTPHSSASGSSHHTSYYRPRGESHSSRARSESNSSRARSESSASSRSGGGSYRPKAKPPTTHLDDIWGGFLKEIDEDIADLRNTPVKARPRETTNLSTPVATPREDVPALPVITPLVTRQSDISHTIQPNNTAEGGSIHSLTVPSDTLTIHHSPSHVQNSKSSDSLSSLPYLYSPDVSLDSSPVPTSSPAPKRTKAKAISKEDDLRPTSADSQFSQFSLSLFPSPPSIPIIRPTTDKGTFRTERDDKEAEYGVTGDSYIFKSILPSSRQPGGRRVLIIPKGNQTAGSTSVSPTESKFLLESNPNVRSGQSVVLAGQRSVSSSSLPAIEEQLSRLRETLFDNPDMVRSKPGTLPDSSSALATKSLVEASNKMSKDAPNGIFGKSDQVQVVVTSDVTSPEETSRPAFSDVNLQWGYAL
ncbi:1087_t:CDS:2 [Acaulospora colombiana]|uniref:1087_t:CDS:1 n=1 Tax=Acaulospora colombiana TaxID=27376 RepID=A0ACA9N3Q2_9GLOM|nr:1087_t:CDS:2 [Acaulospora colombiana]